MRPGAFIEAPLLAALLLAGLGCGPARAWEATGHAVVCAIAWSEMSGTARGEIARLLSGESFVSVCEWADEITEQHPETRRFHYVNVPREMAEIDIARDCPRGCVLSAIVASAAVLRDHAAEDSRRADALKFLAHFVADVHQPLHVSFADDRGGNDVIVDFFGLDANLHNVWDARIIDRGGEPAAAMAERLLGAMTDTERAAWAGPDVASGSLLATVLDWAYESHAVTRALVYEFDGRRIDETYYERALPILERRLTQAGLRLARLVDALLG